MPRRSKGTPPVRDVGRRNRRPGKAYIVPTERNPNGIVAAESRLERNHLLLLSLLPDVRRLFDQALCIDLDNQTLLTSRDQLPIKEGRKAASYTPDAEVEMADGTLCIFESKPACWLEKHAEKHQRAARILHNHGQVFRTLTEEMFTAVFVSNLEGLKKALSHGQLKNSQRACEKIGEALLVKSEWRTLDLINYAGLRKSDIFFGLAYSVIAADLKSDLFTDSANVYAAHDNCDHLKLLEI